MNGFLHFERDEMETVSELLAADTRPVPAPLLEHCPSTLGPSDISTESYISQEIHDLEVERVWKRVWQWACRTEEIPNIGDYYVYDVATLSVVVVRVAEGSGPGAIRAYENVCMHRGTQLAVDAGNVPVFRCPFHGWTWNLDGSLHWVPCEWDFPAVQQDRASFSLPEVRVGLWGGFVFINFDPNCESLMDYLQNIPGHFEHYSLEDRFIAINVRRVMPANWKVTMGAFIEAYHSVVTHPQILPFTGDANTQYDIYDRHSRMITPFAVASPHIGGKNFEQSEILKTVTRQRGANADQVSVAEGERARPQVAAAARERIGAVAGADLSDVCDSMMVDAIEYYIFPNFMPWAAYGSPIQYRFRPNGSDVNSSIMDVVMLMPFGGARPAPAPVHHIEVDQSWTSAPQLGGLGPIFDQDTSNLWRVQKGLRTRAKRTVTLGEYQEARIRHLHQTLAEYLAKP